MALPPTAAPAPAAAAGADPAMAGAAPADAMGAADDEAAEPPVLFTVMGEPSGPFTLVPGDEPEAGDDAAMAGGAPAAAPAGQTFDTPQALMSGIMKLLNPSEGAESSFGKGFRGEPDETAGKPDMPPGA